jgi:hypothetical protein
VVTATADNEWPSDRAFGLTGAVSHSQEVSLRREPRGMPDAGPGIGWPGRRQPATVVSSTLEGPKSAAPWKTGSAPV